MVNLVILETNWMLVAAKMCLSKLMKVVKPVSDSIISSSKINFWWQEPTLRNLRNLTHWLYERMELLLDFRSILI